ncbi:MAG: hypothetical protein HUU21_36195 [Polyangiaceae bacterium]|nr:hypothetical protein [Polyangiaceae bacterium]
MGWWKIQGSDDVIGDGPLDVLTAAINDIISQYESEFNRQPTKAEWEALLTAVLGEEDSETRPIADVIVKSVTIEGA